MATYATLAELKTHLRITDATDDGELGIALAAATEAVDLAMGTTAAQLSPVPSSVKLATLLQASRWFKRQDAPFGVLGAPDMGTFSRLLSKLDPDVEVLLDGYGERSRWGTTI